MSPGRPLRVGIIGTGFGARAVAPAFADTEGCEVVDVVSPRDDAAVAALCTRADVDLISVHSPPFLHLDNVRRAIDGGHAVLCDKPFGRNATEAAEMYELARDAGVLNFLNFEFRYQPIRVQLHALIMDGAAGAVEHVQWTSMAGIWRTPSRRYGWSFDSELGGGWVRVFGSHIIDFVRWTFGDIVDASAALRTTVTERPDADGQVHRCTGEDGFTAIMRTESGASVAIDTTATGAADRPTRVTVVGSDGVLELLSDNVHEIGGRLLLHSGDTTEELFRMDRWGDTSGHDNSAMTPWVKVVRDNWRRGVPDPGTPTFADGLACARVMDQLTAAPVRSDGGLRR